MSALAKKLLVLALASACLSAISAPAFAATPFRGAQSHAMWSSISPADRDRELDLLRDAGANMVRLDVGWSQLQLNGPQYDSQNVARVDDFMLAARSRGLKVILVLMNTPCWASSAPESLKQGCAGAWWNRDVTRYPPSDPSTYGEAAAWSAKRWGADLAAFEVWNEPDDDAFWTADPAAYARLVKATYPKVKAAAPSVPVIAASLSGADGPWLEGMYAAGMAGNFDGLAVHLYTGSNDPDLPAPRVAVRWSLLSGLNLMRTILASHGDGGKGIWVTEMGWSTCGNVDPACVTEAEQTDFYSRALRTLAAQGDVRAVAVYQIRDAGDDRLGRYGILRQDFRPKPAYEAIRAAFNDQTIPSQGLPSQGSIDSPVAPVAPVSTGHLKRPAPPRRARVSLHLKRVGPAIVAIGTAPARTTLRLSTRRCLAGRAVRRSLLVRVGYRGRFARRLGSARRLVGCRVVLHVVRIA